MQREAWTFMLGIGLEAERKILFRNPKEVKIGCSNSQKLDESDRIL
jgi:hypothetical protein